MVCLQYGCLGFFVSNRPSSRSGGNHQLDGRNARACTRKGSADEARQGVGVLAEDLTWRSQVRKRSRSLLRPPRRHELAAAAAKRDRLAPLVHSALPSPRSPRSPGRGAHSGLHLALPSRSVTPRSPGRAAHSVLPSAGPPSPGDGSRDLAAAQRAADAAAHLLGERDSQARACSGPPELTEKHAGTHELAGNPVQARPRGRCPACRWCFHY